MAEGTTYLSCILEDGKLMMGDQTVRGKKFTPHSFTVGDKVNFTPNTSNTAIEGNLVFTGDKVNIAGSIIAKDTYRFDLTFTEQTGDFTIGNIILNMQREDGLIFPAIAVASKVPYFKQAATPGTTGNRYVFSFIERIFNVEDALEITVQAPAYASLAGYKTEYDLPQPSQAVFQQFYVQEPLHASAPFIGLRRAVDNTFWGFPLYSRLGHPYFGILDGGRAGESRLQENSKFYWGARLNTPNSSFKRTYGGIKLTDKPTRRIGGMPLPPLPVS